MKKITEKGKYSLIVSLVTYIVAFFVCFALFFPINVGNVFYAEGDPAFSFKTQDIKTQINCTVDDGGKYSITGSDPQLLFEADGQAIEAVKLKIADTVYSPVNFEVYTAFADGTLSAERCYKGSIFAEQTETVVDIPKGEYSYYRIDIDSDNVVFESLELYDSQPVSKPYRPIYSTNDYIAIIFGPILAAVIAFFLNNRFEILQRILKIIKENKNGIIKSVLFTGLAFLVALIIETLISIIGASGEFNVYRFVLVFGIIELVAVFYLGYKCLKEKPENLFLPITLILGLVMLFGSPVKHICWDCDSHHTWSVYMSYPGTAYMSSADVAFNKVANETRIIDGHTLQSYENDLEYLNEADKTLAEQRRSSISLPHLASGVFIAVARMFGASFEVKYNLGRLAYLLLYSLICYFAIKKIKSGKMILATICLFPTNLFLATNYAYDWFVTGFTILGTAYFVSELQEPDKPISIKDTVIMCVAFVLGALPKMVYIILMAMTLFMRKNWLSKKETKRYYFILASIFLALFTYFIVTTLIKIGGQGDTRGGDVNPTGQLSAILSEPFAYIKLLFKFLSQYLSIGTMREYISHFAYLGIGKYWVAIACLLAFVSLTDASEKVSFKIPLYMRGLAVLLFVGMAALISTALYIYFTPVNYWTVLGCQPRYITPLLAPLLLLVTGKRFNIIKNKYIYNGAVMAVSSAVAMLEIYSMVIVRMI